MNPIYINGEAIEIMAPAGSRESLPAALDAGADSIYFGIEALNMRAHSAMCSARCKILSDRQYDYLRRRP